MRLSKCTIVLFPFSRTTARTVAGPSTEMTVACSSADQFSRPLQTTRPPPARYFSTSFVSASVKTPGDSTSSAGGASAASDWGRSSSQTTLNCTFPRLNARATRNGWQSAVSTQRRNGRNSSTSARTLVPFNRSEFLRSKSACGRTASVIFGRTFAGQVGQDRYDAPCAAASAIANRIRFAGVW